jgi:hypothetical protein
MGDWGFVGVFKRALELPAGSDQSELSPTNRLRMRFNELLSRLEVSVSGATWAALATALGLDVIPVAACRIDGTAAPDLLIYRSAGIASAVRNDTGDYTITLESEYAIPTDESVPDATVRISVSGFIEVNQSSTTEFNVVTLDTASIAADMEFFFSVSRIVNPHA